LPGIDFTPLRLTGFKQPPERENHPSKEKKGRQPTIRDKVLALVRVFNLTMKTKAMAGIITEPQDILDELAASQKNGNVIGIWASPLGTGLFMCGVQNILSDEVEHDMVVILKEKDLNGVLLHAHVLFLQEIEKVFPFKTQYSDPVPQRLKVMRQQ
jgi:hypothetical protein